MRHDLNYYLAVQGIDGVSSRRDAYIRKAKRVINRDWHKNLALEQVKIVDAQGNERVQALKVLKTATRTAKKIKARPDEVLRLGEIIKWADTAWLVTSLDPDNTIQYNGDMDQCAIILRWELEDGTIHEEYAQVEDASKYGSGASSSEYMVTPYFTAKVRVQANEYTLQIKRDKRFLLGQIGVGKLRPFIVSRVNDVVYRYAYENGEQVGSGIVEWTLTEDYDHVGEDSQSSGVAKDITTTTNSLTEPVEEWRWF